MAAKKSNERSIELKLSPKVARPVQKLKEYSQLTGIPVEDLLDECLNKYLAENPAKS